ncbi:GTP 3',8-cyclase MoaA [Hyphobacterium marinum]|uniref:GTP 3',8-cyclase n=1 Tax=Hyphobacterium marinum TaxID=3116574 RepID=A0ABU7LU62_9PROT|nr:GTP 3',8-cyclase MoaA [Hyphobacterium sp. Y6023]MEE2565099.1 GTP 3',8-cyclase MoaA [Hyphobacterium sp. Y6023]
MDRTFYIDQKPPLVDQFGRRITYLRLSVTDRCDLRCVYCMKARPDFLPRSELLSLEELTILCDAFIARGVTKIRLTGGEPLVRKDVLSLIENLGARLGKTGLEEVCLTTNATQLDKFAGRIADSGIERLNISLDTLEPETFRTLTRGGDIQKTLSGIAAAQAAGLRIKINTVALRGTNDRHLPDLIAWAHGQGHDLSLIEVMPVGEIGVDRATQFLSLAEVRETLEARWTLTDLPDTTGGPSRYVRIEETGGRLGFISPLTGNFCAGCNRVRLTCTGQLYMCLGKNGSVDLRDAVRNEEPGAVDALLDEAMSAKPLQHDFDVSPGAKSPVTRDMARTGG